PCSLRHSGVAVLWRYWTSATPPFDAASVAATIFSVSSQSGVTIYKPFMLILSSLQNGWASVARPRLHRRAPARVVCKVVPHPALPPCSAPAPAARQWQTPAYSRCHENRRAGAATPRVGFARVHTRH